MYALRCAACNLDINVRIYTKLYNPRIGRSNIAGYASELWGGAPNERILFTRNYEEASVAYGGPNGI